MENKLKIFLTVAISFVVFGIFSVAPKVLAATDIDTDLPSGSLIDKTNFLPGDVFARTVTITKVSDRSDVKLMLRLDRMNSTGTYNLESQISMKIQKLPGGPFLPLPGGATEKTLESLYAYLDSANNDAFQFDSISGLAGSTFQYKLWFTFNLSADNNYQEKSTTFDILMGIYSADVNDGGGHKPSNNTDGGGAGFSSASFDAGGTIGTSTGTVDGAETPNEEDLSGNSAIAGIEARFPKWPLWIYVLLFFIYGFLI